VSAVWLLHIICRVSLERTEVWIFRIVWLRNQTWNISIFFSFTAVKPEYRIAKMFTCMGYIYSLISFYQEKSFNIRLIIFVQRNMFLQFLYYSCCYFLNLCAVIVIMSNMVNLQKNFQRLWFSVKKGVYWASIKESSLYHKLFNPQVLQPNDEDI